MIRSARLDLRPLPAAAADVLPHDREAAARLIGCTLADEWPQEDLVPLLQRHRRGEEAFGIWLMIERSSQSVVGDIGFFGPPQDGQLELGYGVVAARRGRGYATEAARALVDWALAQPAVTCVIARCDRGNAPSVRLLERLGFVRSGEDERLLRWRLDRESQSAAKKPTIAP